MGYCCGEHLEKKVDSVVVDYAVPAEVTLLPVEGIGLAQLAQSCDYCDKPAKYLVCVTMSPEQWTNDHTHPTILPPGDGTADLTNNDDYIVLCDDACKASHPDIHHPVNVRCEPFDPEVTNPSDAVILGPCSADTQYDYGADLILY